MKRLISILTIVFLAFALLMPIPFVQASSAYEDFTGASWIEVDPNSHINVTQYHIDHWNIRNESAYMYNDKGTDYFNDFTHLIQAKAVSGNYAGRAYFWVLANAVDDMSGLISGTCLSVWFYKSTPTTLIIYLREWYAGTPYSDSYVALMDTMYYFTIQKDDTSLSCKIYGDSDRTNLLDTLSLTLHADHSFRYIYATCSYDGSGFTYYIDCDIENLRIQIVALTFYNTTGGIFEVNDTPMANGTSKQYCADVVLEFGALPVNASHFFEKFNWTGGSSATNPYNYTVTQNMTVWCLFGEVEFMWDLVTPLAISSPFIVLGVIGLVVFVKRGKENGDN